MKQGAKIPMEAAPYSRQTEAAPPSEMGQLPWENIGWLPGQGAMFDLLLHTLLRAFVRHNVLSCRVPAPRISFTLVPRLALALVVGPHRI